MVFTITPEKYHSGGFPRAMADDIMSKFGLDAKDIVEIRVHDEGSLIEVDQVWRHNGIVQTVPDGDGFRLDTRTMTITPYRPV